MSEVLIGEKQQHQDSTQGKVWVYILEGAFIIMWMQIFHSPGEKKYSDSLGKAQQHIHNISFRDTKKVTDSSWDLESDC